MSIECRVRDIISLGSHDMFIAEVLNVLADEKYLDPATGKFSLENASPLVYSHGGYYRQGDYIGHFGFSVKKKK